LSYLSYTSFTTKLSRALFILLAMVVMLACSKFPSHPASTVKGDTIEVRISALVPQVPSYFSYTLNDRKINYFVLLIDGKVQSYFDACETCHPKKLGFRYEDGYLYCRACNEKYSVRDLETGRGNCYPVKLPGEQKGDKYIILIDSLKDNSRLF
jgi:uncharacterized membrane protein